MFKKGIFITYIFLLGVFIILPGGSVNAACSPGIPCTDYDILTNPTAGTDPDLNGPKTGAPAPHTESACDGNFMNQIYSRAAMEASREVIMSEQIIHKPDSVLEYTCFDQRISAAANFAGPIFSESRDWENLTIPLLTGDDTDQVEIINNTGETDGFPDQDEFSVFADNRLDNILEDFLFETLQNYVDGSFSHTFLGEGTTIDNNIAGAIGSGAFDCTHMGTIWNIASCFDFGEDDRFRSFEHLVNFDPRSIPQACSPGNVSTDVVLEGNDPTKLENTNPGLESADGGFPSGGEATECPAEGGPVAGVNTTFANDFIRLANNCDNEENENLFSALDLITTYTELIKGEGEYLLGTAPDDAPNVTALGDTIAIDCAAPLPTGFPVITHIIIPSVNPDGIRVDLKEFEFHNDHVCPNPGCFYVPIKVPYEIGAPLPSPPAGECVPF